MVQNQAAIGAEDARFFEPASFSRVVFLLVKVLKEKKMLASKVTIEIQRQRALRRLRSSLWPNAFLGPSEISEVEALGRLQSSLLAEQVGSTKEKKDAGPRQLAPEE